MSEAKFSHFAFLQAEWPELHENALKAEANALADPRTACFYARRSLELLVFWVFQHDRSLRRPYKDDLSAHLHEPSFKALLGPELCLKAQLVRERGNAAVHHRAPVPPGQAIQVLRELFHLGYWLARSYTRQAPPPTDLSFQPNLLPKPPAAVAPQSQAQLQHLEEQMAARDAQNAALRRHNESLVAELAVLQAQIAEAKAANAQRPDAHDYNEAQTRDAFIDLMLGEAGWSFSRPGHDTEFEVQGMPNAQGKGYVDYVLWGDEGKPLALVEAKRTQRDPLAGQQQAKLYADCLEKQFGQRPIVFLTNGHRHWIWDEHQGPMRPVEGFYTKDELALAIQRRSSRKPLAEVPIDEGVAGRYYQLRAVRRIGEALEAQQRKALVVMATGSGKTRTVIALVDQLMRANAVKRVLFLADRVALVNQAVRAFKAHLKDTPPVNLVTEKQEEGRVYASTYPTMVGLINEKEEGRRRFGVGHFDLIVIDEAHRSVFQKYKAIFDHFDAPLVGLTATPKEELSRNTYGLFGLENGVPTDAYPLEEAVKDGYLVAPVAMSVPLKFQREGIKYAELDEEGKEQWDALDWGDEGPPEEVDPEEVNRWLFNTDTVDKVLQHLMTQGLKVAGGDRLGKTIVFAKNEAHAQFIAARFDHHYPHLKGHFARIITHKTEYAQSLIDDFSKKDSAPHIAISVDMLDTGIDVPEVVNLVFFKVVRSSTKFHQMVGRGTRLCPDLFGPGQHKSAFFLFDFCQNLEYFGQNPGEKNPALPEALGTKLFRRRLELVGALDLAALAQPPEAEDQALRQSLVGWLHGRVQSMNLDNFLVRPKRAHVERYAKAEAWTKLSLEDHTHLNEHLANLPSAEAPEAEEAKRFDLLLLRLQLGLLRPEGGWDGLKQALQELASQLESQASIPAIGQHRILLQELQSEAWWEGLTLPMLEAVRQKLRGLVHLLPKGQREVVYTDFEDELGEAVTLGLPGMGGVDAFERFRIKMRAFLKAHEAHVAVQKLRRNKALTASDLAELERMLLEAGGAKPEELAEACERSDGLGLFVRSLVGLEREAAKEALGELLAGGSHTGNQIQFLNLVVDELTAKGAMTADRLYESPFTDRSSSGPEGILPEAEVDRLVALLAQVRERAFPTPA